MKINKFYAGLICDEKLLFSSRDVNGLYSYNLIDKKLRQIGIFENEAFSGKVLHRDCFVWGEDVIFIPQDAEKIHIYNYKSEKLKSIIIPKRVMPPLCHLLDEEKGILWLIPSVISDKFLKINLRTSKVESISANHSEKEITVNPIFHRMAIVNDYAIAPSINDGNLYLFSLDRENNKIEYKTKQIDKSIKGAFIGYEGVWLSSSNENKIYKYDCQLNKVICEYELLKKCANNVQNGLSNIIETEKYIVTIPAWSDEIVVLNKNGEVVRRHDFSDYKYEHDRPLFIRSIKIDNKIYINAANMNKMVVINADNLDMELIEIPEIEINEVKELGLILGKTQKEGELISLQEFLHYIRNDE